eukprot:jgi/Mesen1/4239/ME000022S03528
MQTLADFLVPYVCLPAKNRTLKLFQDSAVRQSRQLEDVSFFFKVPLD